MIARVVLFRGVSFRFEGVDHCPISELTSDAHYSTTFGTKKKLSSLIGAFLTTCSAIPPSVNTSARFFIAMGVTDVIGSTPRRSHRRAARRRKAWHSTHP